MGVGAARPITRSLLPPNSVSGRGHVVNIALILSLCISVFSACSNTPPVLPHPATPVTVVPQRDWAEAILYFVLIDRFADGDPTNNAHADKRNPGAYHGGDLKGLTQQLDEIASLGVTAIWINPVVKQIDKPVWAQGPPGSGWQGGFEHWPFHGYWADDFNRLEPHFGSEADLKAFVDAAHARGLKVLLDVVYNHVGYGSHYLTDPATRNWFHKRLIDCGADPIVCQVGGLPDLRTELPEVREYLFHAHLGLAKRVGLDGFRLDTVKHVEHDFWRAQRARSRAELGANFFLLGEVWGGSAQVLDPWFADDEMDAGFDFSFRGNCEGFVDGRGRAIAFASYLQKRHQVRQGHFLAQYLSSHDEPMFLSELGNDLARFKECVALQMTTIGIPVIYYGEEVARKGSTWPTNRSDMPWGNRAIQPGHGLRRNEALRDYYRQLIALRRAHPALSRGKFHALSTAGDLLVYAREDESSTDTVIIAVNRGAKAASASVPLPERWRDGLIHEALSGAAVQAHAGQLPINTPPHTAQVYVAERKITGAIAWRTSASNM
jgi:glycosidase